MEYIAMDGSRDGARPANAAPANLQQLGLYEQLARIGKVVVNPKRIELLDLLCQGERSVDALAVAASLKVTTASAHLQVMWQARLVVTRRDGTRVYYRAASEEVCRFVAALGVLARARLAEVEQILQEIGTGARSTKRVSRAELLDKVRSGEVVVLDVRPTEEYQAGHIPGAVSMPLEHLEAHLDDLDPDVEVVAYCRGPLCLLAPQAVDVLQERGYHARCLEDGMPEWRQAGLDVARGQGGAALAGPPGSGDRPFEVSASDRR
ncbi:MAG: metalloregulator ArsR/SmtB family transcription factor [Actinobacteria bacterium]|nr:metalloregulator ArsR/SmtB family transcription factor [Actinomycetota bacterium]